MEFQRNDGTTETNLHSSHIVLSDLCLIVTLDFGKKCPNLPVVSFRKLNDKINLHYGLAGLRAARDTFTHNVTSVLKTLFGE